MTACPRAAAPPVVPSAAASVPPAAVPAPSAAAPPLVGPAGEAAAAHYAIIASAIAPAADPAVNARQKATPKASRQVVAR